MQKMSLVNRSPYYDHGGIAIYHGDCREVLPTLPAADLIFTSPPYLNRRKYELESFDWHEVVPPALASAQDHGKTQILVNLGQCHTDGRVDRYWIDLCDAMERAGWRWFGMYPWDQGSGMPGEWSGRFAPSHEIVLHFNRGGAALVKSARCSLAGKTPSKRTMRSKDGTMRSFTSDGAYSSHKVQDSVIRVHRAIGAHGGHPATFSPAFAATVISAFTGSVLDPFMGSGTTLRVAKDLGRKAIGIEIEEKYCEVAARRLAQEVLF